MLYSPVLLFSFQSILEGELDLSYLTCETVNVSFAAVGEDGLSVYSPSTEVLIYGGMLSIQLGSNLLMLSMDNYAN